LGKAGLMALDLVEETKKKTKCGGMEHNSRTATEASHQLLERI